MIPGLQFQVFNKTLFIFQERTDKVREEYDKILQQKLSEQYDAFVKFIDHQIQQRFNESQLPSYLSWTHQTKFITVVQCQQRGKQSWSDYLTFYPGLRFLSNTGLVIIILDAKVGPAMEQHVKRIYHFINYSSHVSNGHLITGFIWIPDFLDSGIQMVYTFEHRTFQSDFWMVDHYFDNFGPKPFKNQTEISGFWMVNASFCCVWTQTIQKPDHSWTGHIWKPD